MLREPATRRAGECAALARHLLLAQAARVNEREQLRILGEKHEEEYCVRLAGALSLRQLGSVRVSE